MNNANKIFDEWLSEFDQNLKNTSKNPNNLEKVLDMFNEDECFWRDLVSFSWNLVTSEGKDKIKEFLNSTLQKTQPQNWKRDTDAQFEDEDTVSAFATFETKLGRGKAHIRIKKNKAWTLLTTLYELKGFEEEKGFKRPLGAQHGAHKDSKNWLEKKQDEIQSLGFDKQPYVLIVGGGQGGIALASRLRQLKVPTIVIDKHPRPGDQWRGRYKSLCLHDPVWYDHLPYIKFPDNWPIFSPKDKLGDWLEMYVKVMEINYWSNTECLNAEFDENAKEWKVKVRRKFDDGLVKEIELRPSQLVLATGMSGVANMPSIPGMDKFKGDVHHSSKHPGGEVYKGKKVVVVGSNNSSHDICADLVDHGAAKVVMLQRSSTHVSRSDSLMKIMLGPLYSEEAVSNGITTEMADLIFASIPYKIMHRFHKLAYDEIKKVDADFYKRLEASGFLHDFGADDSGLFMKYLRRGSGYYIDIGASELIINGSIELVRGQIKELSSNAVILEDGTQIEADAVVFATGFSSMNGWAATLISQEVADKVGKCWGLGSNTTKDPGPWEGELRNMWKPTQQENLWFHGGNLHQSRHYSLYLSLQLKARFEKLPIEVYNLAQVHHLS